MGNQQGSISAVETDKRLDDLLVLFPAYFFFLREDNKVLAIGHYKKEKDEWYLIYLPKPEEPAPVILQTANLVYEVPFINFNWKTLAIIPNHKIEWCKDSDMNRNDYSDRYLVSYQVTDSKKVVALTQHHLTCVSRVYKPFEPFRKVPQFVASKYFLSTLKSM